jgi:crossover junction endodeoxyribonuclease RuvC
MIILGIDPGIATLGYGVLEKDKNGNCRAIDYGVVVTPKEETMPVRLAMLEKGVSQVIEKYKPDEIALEELFFTKNVTTGIAVAHARGVALLSCVKYCPYLYEYTPMQIKQALTGYGRAEKAQIQQVVTTMLRLEKTPKPDDAADALAIALCHATVSRFGNLFKVDNMTRTKGNNTQAGNAFQKMLKEEIKKTDKQAAKAAARQTKKTTDKALSNASIKASANALAKPTLPKAKAVQATKMASPSPLRQPQKKLNTAAEIARQIAAQMEE